MTVDAETCAYVLARGGTIWVRSVRTQCCGGGTTWLRATTSSPTDAARYWPLDAGWPIRVYFDGAAGSPDQLALTMRGLLHRGPAALWDGCATKL